MSLFTVTVWCTVNSHKRHRARSLQREFPLVPLSVGRWHYLLSSSSSAAGPHRGSLPGTGREDSPLKRQEQSVLYSLRTHTQLHTLLSHYSFCTASEVKWARCLRVQLQLIQKHVRTCTCREYGSCVLSLFS